MRDTSKAWVRRTSWGGVVVLGAAAALGSLSSPIFGELMDARHELPVASLTTPDRLGERPAGSPDEPGPGEVAPARATLLGLSLVATVTDPDDTRAAVADDGGLWVATGGGLLRVPFDEPDAARWWTTADHLPDHRLTAITQVPGGLALGTEGGTVLMVDVQSGEPVVVEYAQVAEARVSDLLHADDALYVATWGGGIWMSDGTGDALEFREVGPRTGLRSRQVTSLAWQDGELLAGTAGAGLWVRGADGRSRRFVAKGGLAGDFVFDLVSSPRGVEVVTPTGLSRYDRGVLRTWSAASGDLKSRAMPRALAADGTLAVAGSRIGPRDSAELEQLPPPPDGLGPWNGVPAPEVRWIVVADGRRWAGTGRGIVVQDGDGWRWIVHSGPGSNDLTTVSARGGSLLVGTFDRGAWRDGRALPLGNAEINDAWIDGDGIGWIATSGGLARVDADGGPVHTYGRLHGLDSEHVGAVRGSAEGLWVGTSAGVQRFDGGSFGAALGGADQERVGHVYTLAVGAGEQVLAGTLEGLWQVRRSAAVGYRYETGELPDSWVNGIALGSDGRLWAGTYDHGLGVRDADGEWRWLVEGDGVSCGWVNPGAMAALADGTVLVGTMGGGLLRVSAGGELERWTMADGLAGDDVTAVSVDGDTIWVGTRSGLSRLQVQVEVDDGPAS